MALRGQRWSVTTAGEKDTQSWKQIAAAITKAGASVESIVHKRIDVLVASALALRLRTQRVRRAAKLGLPVVGVEFIEACVNAPPGGRLPDTKDYPPLRLDQKVVVKPAAPVASAAPLPRAAVFRRLLNFAALGLPQPRWVRDYQLSLAVSHLRSAARRRKAAGKRRLGVSSNPGRHGNDV